MTSHGVLVIFASLVGMASSLVTRRNPAPGDYVSHATHAEEIAADRHDLGIQKGNVFTKVYTNVEAEYAQAKGIAQEVVAKCNKRIADFESYATSSKAKKFAEGASPKDFYGKLLKDVDALLKEIP